MPSIISTPRHIRRMTAGDSKDDEDSSEEDEISDSEEGTAGESSDDNEIRVSEPEGSQMQDEQNSHETIQWRFMRNKDDLSLLSFEFMQDPPSRELPPDTPLQYFKQYFTDELLEELCYLSNLYAVRKNPNITFSIDKVQLQQYLGIHICMTLIKRGASRRYWGRHTRVNQVADTMSKKQFEK